MSYAESLLATGEQILYRGRQHPLAPLSDARNAVVLVLAGLVLFFAAVVVLTMLAAEAFDPRLIWDSAKPEPARHD